MKNKINMEEISYKRLTTENYENEEINFVVNSMLEIGELGQSKYSHCEMRLKRIISSEYIICAIIKYRDEIIGTFQLRFDPIFEHAWSTYIYVTERYRRQGIGKMLKMEQLRIAKDLGAKELLSSTQHNSIGESFTQGIGLKVYPHRTIHKVVLS